MTDAVVNLDDYRPHQATYAACLECGKDWVAAAPADVVAFECPTCATLSGVLVEPGSVDFINAYMRTAKRKSDIQHRTLVLLNAQRMLDTQT